MIWFQLIPFHINWNEIILGGNMSQLAFGLEMAAALGQMKTTLTDVQQQVLVEVAARLLDRSPVDTGHFKANWQHGFGSLIPTEELAEQDKDGQATLDRLTADIAASGPGLHTFVNNTPYAEQLEFGSSQQAPSGIVGITAAEVPDIVTSVTTRSIR